MKALKTCFIVIVVSLSLSVALAGDKGELELRPACDDRGFSGKVTKDGVTVLFEACEKSGNLKGKLEFEDGSPLAEINIKGQKIEMSIGGVDMATMRSMSKEEVARLEPLFECPEAMLAVKLPKRLLKIFKII